MHYDPEVFGAQRPLQELIEDFEFLDDWEDRYAYLIDLGKQLTTLPQSYKSEEYRVKGCTSQVWLIHSQTEENGQVIHHYNADSDAFIVRGLVAIVLSAYSGKTNHEIEQIDLATLFSKIGLERNLSISRRNGFASMVAKVKEWAQQS
ncbi:MAG: cysteine desulfuration protein SufE [Myxococcales bacterium]|nr:cysteine desulfuration protein SufE [Myxococcales bacterium]